MNKKTVAVVFTIVVIILSLIMYTKFNLTDTKILEQTFVISAVYYDKDGYAEISFQDKSNNTKHVTLEILGMSESFHKEFISTAFVEKIQFTSVPKYGWQSIPITLLVKHEEFGNIGIKTEIRPIGDVPATVIFSYN